VPSPVQNLTNVVDVKGGTKFTCALLADRTVACWGVDDDGQLGTGEAVQNFWAHVPLPLLELSDVVAIACGSSTACAVIADGTVQCWGAYAGLFSEDTTTDRGKPRPLPGIAHAVAVDVGVASACVLEEGGVVSCFGYGDRGGLGNGSADSKYHAATPIPELTPATHIDAALEAACAVLEGGGVRCWGTGTSGMLGNGSETDSAIPVEVVGFRGG
jgi:alpha-tubulin suppressor-like RCC1 family protein